MLDEHTSLVIDSPSWADTAAQSWHLFSPKVDLFAKLFSVY